MRRPGLRASGAHELPDVLDRIEFGGSWRQGQEGDVGRHGELVGGMPSGLVENEDGAYWNAESPHQLTPLHLTASSTISRAMVHGPWSGEQGLRAPHGATGLRSESQGSEQQYCVLDIRWMEYSYKFGWGASRRRFSPNFAEPVTA